MTSGHVLDMVQERQLQLYAICQKTKIILEIRKRFCRESLLFKRNAAGAAQSFQPCPTLCNPIDSRPPGSSVPGILQARVLE